jgi:hypothetical protein
VPVVWDSPLMASAMLPEARLRTHSPVRTRFRVVWEEVPRPRMQALPTQKAEDVGALFEVRSVLVVVRSTTGVPQ